MEALRHAVPEPCLPSAKEEAAEAEEHHGIKTLGDVEGLAKDGRPFFIVGGGSHHYVEVRRYDTAVLMSS